MKFTIKDKEYTASFPTIRGNESDEDLQIKSDYHAINFPGEDVVNPTVTCFIKDAESNENLSVTKAECSSKDAFRKTTGEKISLLRGLVKLGFTKEERASVWEQYFISSRPRRKSVGLPEKASEMNKINQFTTSV